MGGRGVHFALNTRERDKLVAVQDSDEAVREVVEEIEERWSRRWVHESDKAWDALHRCLTDGTLTYEGGRRPLKLCFIGGVQLHGGPDFLVSAIDTDDVAKVAAALGKIDRAWLRRRYDRIPPKDYRPQRKSDEDFDYAWASYQGLPAFFARAARAGRDVIFTVDP